MPASFLHDGDYLDHVPDAALQAGTVVVIADAIGVAVRTTPANTLGALAMSGVFEVPRAPEGVIPQGKALYWHILEQRAVTDAGDGTHRYLGIAALESPDAAPTVRVRLNH